MKIDEILQAKLLKEAERARMHFLRAAQIVSKECNEDEKKLFRRAAEEPGRHLQKLLDTLRVQT